MIEKNSLWKQNKDCSNYSKRVNYNVHSYGSIEQKVVKTFSAPFPFHSILLKNIKNYKLTLVEKKL